MSKINGKTNTLLRTSETFKKYHKNPKRTDGSCFVCTAKIERDYEYWHTIDNEFPYDAVAEDHKMLVPKRHVSTFEELTSEEYKELMLIKKDLNASGLFDAIIENFEIGRTFMPHYHVHLIKWIRR